MPPALKGITLKVSSVVCFTLMAALIRWVGEGAPVGQILFARSFFALLPLVVWFGMQRQLGDISASRFGGHFVRSSIGTVSMFFMFSALARLSLPDATMLHYTSPLVTVLIAAVVLGEPLRLPRVVAVLLGLAGVGLMLWPHLSDGTLFHVLSATGGEAERVSQGILFALAGAFTTACVMVQIRRLVQTETTASIVFWFAVISALFGLATLPWGWVWPDAGMATALFAIGILGGIGQILLTAGYRYAEASVIAPFEYTSLIWALTIGWLAFSDLPDWFALAGGLVVIASGILVIRDERRRGIERAKARQAEPEA